MFDRLRSSRTTSSRRCRLALCALATVALAGRPAHAADKVYFSQNTNVTNILVSYINGENVRLDISSWYLSEHSISIALANAFNIRHVPVRIIGDRAAIFEADPNTKREYYWLASQGIPIRLRFNPTWFPEIDHWKAAIFVGQNVVEFGSGNFAPTELAPIDAHNYDDESELFADDPLLVNAFKTKFDRMWNDTTAETSIYGGPPYLRNWSDACVAEPRDCDFYQQYPNPVPMNINTARLEPDYPMPADMYWGQGTDFNNRLVQEIGSENNWIDLVAYRLEVENITQALLAKHAAGVPVAVIIDPAQYTNNAWPEYWLTHANIDRLWAAGVDVRQRNHAGVTHMKSLITSQWATNASSNFSANWQRDHNYFISRSTKTVVWQAFVDAFNAMWNNTTDFGPLVPTKPNQADIVSPAPGASGVPTNSALVWSRAAWAVSYDVYFGTAQSGMSLVANVPAAMVENPPTTYSWTPPSGLAGNTTYLWRIVSKTNATPRDPTMIASTSPQTFSTGSGGGGGGGGGGGLSPYSGTPVPIPGQIDAEKFDNGGEGVAYHDTTAGNSGGQFRNTGVDIEAASEGGFDVGWTAQGEWLNYTVNVASAGTYTAQLRVAAPGGASLHIGFNTASSVWTTVSIPATGGWQSWTTVSVPVTLGAGIQQMTILFDTGAMNLRNVIVSSSGGGGGGGLSPYLGSPVSIPGTINAENFDNGGEGVAYADSSAGNSGGQYRTSDVDIEAASEGGYDVGWTAPGEWLNYTVNVTSAGNYTVQLRVASPGGATMHVGFNTASSVWKTVSIPATGGWQSWTTVSVAVTLGGGRQQLTLLFDTGGMNIRTIGVN